MSSDSEDNDVKMIKEQESRAKLRELFLKAINELHGKPCSVLTYEKTSLDATFSGWNMDGSEILVKDLNTPAFVVVKSALLRTPDVLAVRFNGPVELP